MKKITGFIFAAISVLISMASFSSDIQNNSGSTTADLIEEGNKLLSSRQFNAAIPVWQNVLQQDPENFNANFKLGMCYLNSFDEQMKALPFLRRAASKLTDKYNFFDALEKSAPYDALYFLGQTYLTANMPDSALWAFFQYSDFYNGNPPIQVDKMIRYSVNARNAAKSPRDVTLKNPGKNVNSQYSESNPVLTLDNSVMFFSSRRLPAESTKLPNLANGKYDEDIYFTQKDASGNWNTPAPFKWNTDKNEAPLFLSPDGLTLYFNKEINGQKDIYFSNYVDKVWGVPKALSEVNSSSNESGISISADGNYLYFSSEREGGFGGADIYMCEKSGKRWGKPKNLGSFINTASNEISPYINPNGKTLFYSSNGITSGIGGYDIYYSEFKDDNTWTVPENLGYPINTVRDDIHYYIISGGTRYYSTIRDDKNSYDIFKIEGGGYSIENIDVSGEVVTLTKELSVTDVLEIEKTIEKEVQVVETIETTVEIIKEVEKVDLEKERRILDSLTVLARTQAQYDSLKFVAEKARADADKIKAEADIKTAAVEKAKAEAEMKKSDAEKAKSDAEKAKQDAAKAVADAAKAKSEATIAAAQKVKDELAKARTDLDVKKAEAQVVQSNALKAKSEADLAKSEENKAKIEADKIKLAADKAKADEAAILAKAQLAEAEKPKFEAQKVQAEATKAKAEADKLKAQETLAAAQKAKDDAVIARVEIAKATEETKKAAAEKAKADLEKAKADAELKKQQAIEATAIAAKAKAEADKAKGEQTKAVADENKAKVEESVLKLKNQLAETEKPKYEALKIQSEATKAKAEVEKLKAQATLSAAQKAKDDAVIAKAELAKNNAEILKAKAEIAAAEKAKADAAKADSDAKKAEAMAVKAKADAEAKQAQLEILKLQPPKK